MATSGTNTAPATRPIWASCARLIASQRAGSDDEGLVVRRGELAFVLLNLYPYAPGHLMVCPYRHIADYTETTDAEAAEKEFEEEVESEVD